MRSDWVISGAGHVALLVAGLITLASSKPPLDPADYVRVSIVTDADVSRAALGQKNAPHMAAPKPLADKIGPLKQDEQTAAKVSPKQTITTNSPTPMPQPKPESKPEPKPEPKTAEQKPDQTRTDDFKADKIAELLKKTTPPKPKEKPTHETHKYDANQIAQLLDHREAQRQVATADTLNGTAGLGAPSASPNAQLSQTEIDALRDLFKPDGSLAQMPTVVAGSASPMGPALAESGKRALLMCQPFTMLKPEHYAQWKDITVDFNPRDLSN
jgi:outer membrane biosynthesis protein TonB